MTTTRELAVTVVRHEERINNLEHEQETQAEAIRRLEDKIDGLRYWTYGVLAGVIIPVADVLIRRLGG